MANFEDFLRGITEARPALPPALLRRLARAYGTRIDRILGDARTLDDLGENFGGGLTQAEVDYLLRQEWATTAEDILYRRSKLGLHVPAGTAERLGAWLAPRAAADAAPRVVA